MSDFTFGDDQYYIDLIDKLTKEAFANIPDEPYFIWSLYIGIEPHRPRSIKELANTFSSYYTRKEIVGMIDLSIEIIHYTFKRRLGDEEYQELKKWLAKRYYREENNT